MGFEKIGLMLDCSRNAVPRVETLKTLIDLLAEMGYNRLELYTEDTYEIKGRPYFGHLRGRYTGAELKEIDAYAAQKGIELTPCIQVLAHVNQIFRWPQFQNVRDCGDILLVDEPETYKLIDDMLASLAENFTSRNVNIGCDEAHMVGLGKFLDRFGFQDRFDIINRHIGKVLEIAAKYGFKCAMWSDMYFRLAFGGEYTNTEKPIPPEVLEKVPESVSLIYWDYYHTDPEHYRKMFAGHSRFGNDIEFAGGAWKWTGFVPDNRHGMRTYDAAVVAAREYGVKNVMLTAWGDNGAESSIFSILPSMYHFAKLCGAGGDSSGFEEFLDLDKLNDFGATEKNPNADKYFLYNDCFAGIMDAHIDGGEAAHYREVARILKTRKDGEFSYIFDTAHALVEVLELKADLGVRTRAAYRAGDKDALKKLADEYAEVIRRIEKFHDKFTAQWLRENKPFGLEVHDMRLGGLIKRIDACRHRLFDKNIPELDEDILPFGEPKKGYWYHHLLVVSTGIT